MQRVVLEMHGVSVSFDAKAPVLRDVNIHIGPGWTGLVGANGAGKTTLLRVIAGELAPSEGSVRLRPDDALVVTCPQEVATVSPDIASFADEYGELHARLELAPADLARWSSLSPGERKRWQIGAALHRQPDVLLVDEPTNHLDEAARRLLACALSSFRGVGVLVSHDRALLDALPSVTLRVHDGRVARYAGPYDAARRVWEGERRAAEDAHEVARRKVRAIASRLDDARRTQASTEASRSASSRMKSARDHDARSALAKGRAASAEARAGRSVAVVRSELARAEDDVPRIERDRTLGREIFARFERAPQAVLFHVDEDELRAGDRTVLRDVRVSIGRDDRVRLAGANGAGKTTLLRALLASRPRERVLSLPQELEPEAIAAHVETLASLEPAERGRVLSVFAALGSDPERIASRRDARLSPGEARKLALSLGLGRSAWALVLDEPTNHLDLPSIERLERALATYPGCVVLVSHDERFASAVTTRTLLVERGTVR